MSRKTPLQNKANQRITYALTKMFNLNKLCKKSDTLTKQIKPLKVLLASIGIMASSSSLAQSANQPAERWFEIEVILLQQLMDDSNYNENFSELNTQAKKPSKHIDLIYKHLKQVSAYKYLLASCNGESDALPINLENEQSWQQLILTMPENFGEDLVQLDPINGQPPQQTVYSNQSADTLVAEQSSNNELLSDSLLDDTVSPENLDDIDLQISFTDESKNNDIKPFTFNFYCHSASSDSLFTQVTDEFYQIPKVLSGHEDVYSSQPYLLTKDSLQLTHIYRALRRSKEFRPLTHLAWRQPVLDARKATPVRLVAGSNIEKPKEKLTTDKNQNEKQMFDLSVLEAEKQGIIRKHINDIATDIQNGNIDSQKLIADLKGKVKRPLITESIDKQIKGLATEPGLDVAKNLQTWALEGLFKVHLDHYLFINSEFTMLIEDSSENATEDNPAEILVPFKQNRRVISGEIHYFDHPYMGMIVQIRRHARPEPIQDVEPDTL